MMGRYRRIGRVRRAGRDDRTKTQAALSLAGIEGLGHRPFRHLSGGQKQRALIARALAAEPDLLVLDEPTSGLDLTGETSIMSLIDRLHGESGITVVMVSHQLTTVARWVRRIGILHEGRLEIGPVDRILTSQTLERVYGAGAGVATVGETRVVIPPEPAP
jgi:ABC-type Mn2+/Zn2+ transport system ATPase subunit